MRERPNPTVVLVYEDEETATAVEAAARSSQYMKDLVTLKGAAALVDYLAHCVPGAPGGQLPCPNLILFDLKASLNGSREVLARLKQDLTFKPIPVVVLARAPLDTDSTTTYDLGVNAFVNRPDDPNELARMLQIIENFWLGVVSLPHAEKAAVVR